MKRAIQFIPNLITLGNLFCGFLALIFIAREQMVTAIVCVAVALVLDYLDGFLARLLHAQSKLGVQLDSLADLVTSGVVPGFILFQMIIIAQGYYFVDIGDWTLPVWMNASVAAMVPMAAAYRLGKFNLIESPSSHFQGLPTPAMNMVVLGIPLVLEAHYHLNFYHPLSDQFVDLLGDARRWDPSDRWVVKLLYEAWFYQAVSLVLALLMVSSIPMLSVKLKGLSWKQNKWTYMILIWVLMCYLIFVGPYLSWFPLDYGLIDYLILPIFMIGYFILSFIYATFEALNRNKPTDEIQS
jgi:CDP-diacylglycerol--serine O-phosphatidyltransferase